MAAGSIVISLLMETGSFSTDTARAEKRLRDMEKSARATGKALGSAIGAGAGIAVAGLGLYIKNTIEAEKVQAQLMARIKDTAGAADRSLQQLNEQADKLQSLTIFDDEAIGGAQAMLLTFKNIEGLNFDLATEAVLDLSTAMGSDLNSAALQLGKALNDPIQGLSALGRAGVQFSEDQKKVIKSLVDVGDVAGAQRIILKELEGQMGTAAEAARNTLGGALQGLKNTIDNLLEGDSGSEGMMGMRQAVDDLNTSLNDPEIKKGIDSLAEGFLKAGNAAVQAAAKIGGFIGQYQEFLSSKGFARSDSDTSLEDLQTRLAKLQEQSGKAMTRAFAGDAIRSEIKQVEDLIKAFPFREVTATVDSTALDRGSLTQEPSGGSGSSAKAARTRDAAKATKELTEAEKAYNEIMEVNALIDEMVAGFRMDQVAADYEAAKAQDRLIENAKELHADILFENELLGKTREHQELLTAARYLGAAAATEQGRAALDALEKQQAFRQEMESQIEIMDGIRDATKGLFSDLIDGSKSFKDAFTDALDTIVDTINQVVAKNLAESLFGKPGDSSGGWIGSLIGAFAGGGTSGSDAGSLLDLFASDSSFGGAFASGGDVFGNRAYLVGEQGPELFVPRTAGMVVPNDRTMAMASGAGSSAPMINNFAFAAPTSTKTQTQMAARVGFELRRSQRFGT